jgi:hypothetical protein
MQSVEDQQDVIAAQKAKEETRADSAEFDENVAAADPSTDHRNIESPSDQYMELINGVRFVEGSLDGICRNLLVHFLISALNFS